MRDEELLSLSTWIKRWVHISVIGIIPSVNIVGKLKSREQQKKICFFFQDRIKDQSVSNKRMRQKPPIHFYRNYLLYLHTRAYKSPRYSRILVFYVVCTISCNDSALWAITRGLCMCGNTYYTGGAWQWQPSFFGEVSTGETRAKC